MGRPRRPRTIMDWDARPAAAAGVTAGAARTQRSSSVSSHPQRGVERVPMVTPVRYKTATATLSERWRSFKRRQRVGQRSDGDPEDVDQGDSEDQEVSDEGVGDVDDVEAICLSDSPPADDYGFFESLDGGLEDDLTVRICKETIRSNLMELVRTVSGSVSRLEDLEAGRVRAPDLDRVFGAAGPTERSVALLFCCFLGRADLVRALLKSGADRNFVEPSDGLGALHLAAFSGSVECAKLLLAERLGVDTVHRAFAPLHCAVFGNAVETARLLLREGARVSPPGAGVADGKGPGRPGSPGATAECPLHCAVRARSPDCVQLLLEAGADPRCAEPGGWTALHIAADRGSVKCVKLLLDAGADVHATTTERRQTALHLAAEGGCSEALELLLARGADPAARNSRGQTALHLAARAQSLESVELLLAEGADPNASDADQRTPLHAAVGKALVAFDMVEALLSWRADVNARDKFGYTPLHVAALNELAQCVETLLYHGADVAARTKGGVSALSIVARKTPASLAMLYQRLDAAVSMHDPEGSHREVELTLDFRPILQHSHKGEAAFLKTFVDEEGQKVFLQHPLCQAFLHLKWQKVRKLYAARIALWGVFTAMLTLYVLTALAHDCFNEGRNVTATPDFCRNNSMIGVFLLEHPVVIEVEWYVLLVLALIEVLRKLHGAAGYGCATFKQFLLQSDNVIEWLVLVSVPVVSYMYAGRTFNWQNHVGAFGVLFAWTNLMMMIGQLPTFGTYVAMYTRVQTEVAKLLLAYACLLVGFTISFCVMFPAARSFSNPYVGFIKILVMMTGELDFEDLLFGNAPNKPALLLSVSAHFTFVMFLLSVTIVLMNLMVGIAVHDIQGLKKTAILSKLVRQTNLISYIERALFRGYLPSHLQKLLRRSALVSPSGYRVVLHVKPLNPRERRLPRPILAAAYEVAKQRRKGKHTISSHGSSVAQSHSKRTTFLGGAWQGQSNQDGEQFLQMQSHINELTQEVQELRETMKELVAVLGKNSEATKPKDS